MNAPLTEVDMFFTDEALKAKDLSFEVHIEQDRNSLAIFQDDDCVALAVTDARALRDYLNKVLP